MTESAKGPWYNSAGELIAMNLDEPHGEAVRISKDMALTEIDQLLAQMDREYPHVSRLTFRIDPFTPPAFEARLVVDGWAPKDALVLALDGELRRQSSDCDIRPIEDENAWRAYADLKRLDCGESLPSGEHTDDTALAHAFTHSNRLKCPPVQFALAYQDGRAVGHCSAWEGTEGVGQVEDLFVDPSYRHRGIATALIHYGVKTARARGAGAVVIVVDPKNTAKTMYTALGWRPVAVCREYGKSPGA